jgi:hypothetical protein
MKNGSNWNPITSPAFAVSDGNVPHVLRFDEGWVSESLGVLTSSLVDPDPIVRHPGQWWYEEHVARIHAQKTSKARLAYLRAETEQHQAILAGKVRVLRVARRTPIAPEPPTTFRLTEDQARMVWTVVAEHAGDPNLDPSHSAGREAFVRSVTDPKHPTTEFRFKGRLGSGGKIYVRDDDLGPHVGYYIEDRTPERDAMCSAANEALAKLFRSEAWGSHAAS